MGTTASAFATEGASIQIVVEIEGYPYLLTDGSPSIVAAAYTATDWTQCLGGLTVDWSGMEQSIDPWARDIDVPSLSFRVIDYDGNDRFGIDTHAEYAGNETDSTAPISRWAADKITCRSVADFDASGTIYIGPENIGYTSKSSSPPQSYFDGVTRGRYAPFKANTESSQRFKRVHAPGSGVLEQRIKISSAPRRWIGRQVRVNVHTKSDAGLNTRAQAACVFAGRISGLRDQSDGATLVECEDLRAAIRDAQVLRYQFGATIRPGIWLTKRQSGSNLLMARDVFTGTGRSTTLKVVDRTPASAYEIATGFYTVDEFEDRINTWLTTALVDLNLFFAWNVNLDASTDAGRRCTFTASYASSLDDTSYFQLTSHDWHVSGFLGFEEETGLLFTQYGEGSRSPAKTSPLSPTKYPTHFDGYEMADSELDEGWRLVLDNPHGVWTTVSDHAPRSLPLPLGATAGFLKVSDGSLLCAQRYSDTLFKVQPYSREAQGAFGGQKSVRWDEMPDAELTVSQIVILEGQLDTLFTKFLASTGDAGYNHADYDALPLGMGAAIPWECLGDQWLNTLGAMAEASSPTMVVLDKPIKLWDVFKADFCLRRISIIWKAGSYQCTSWSTPTSETGLLLLTESNKAMDAQASGIDGSPMALLTDHLVTQITVKYHRNLQGQYEGDPIIFVDEAAIADHGMTKSLTIELRNTHAMLPQAQAHVVNLAAGLAAWMPILSRPLRMIRRSVDLGQVLDVGPGDHALVTDEFARDPATGARGLSEKPAVVFRHRWDLGGEGAPFTAEVDLVVAPIDRVAMYAPAAELDETADSGGFSSGYNAATTTLRCHAHKYSESSQGVDASFFNQSDAITIVEMDTASPTLAWERTIQSISGNDIVINAVLAAPAYDATKKYRIVYGPYSGATAQQRAKVFLADDADGKIQDLTNGNRWPRQNIDTAALTASDPSTDPVNFVGSFAYEEGYSLDVGHERDICNILNNAINYRCAPVSHAHFGYGPVPRQSDTSVDYTLLALIPFSFGGRFPGGYYRRLTVNPVVRNLGSTNGTLIVTLSAQPPAGSGVTNDAGVKLYGFPATARRLAWTVSARDGDLKYLALGEQRFDLRALGDSPWGFLCFEATPDVQIVGVSKSVGPLERVITWD